MRLWVWVYGLALAALMCGIACGTPTDSAAPGQLIILDDFPSDYIDPRPVRIWLPPGYDGKQPHAVLYMHDGQMLFDSSLTWNGYEWQVDETMTRLLAEDNIRPAIVVGIDNNGPRRAAEYFPQAILDSVSMDLYAPLAARWLGDRPLADAYLQFLTRELKPYIDSGYQTLPGRDHTFIMGSSMGGLISLYALCEISGDLWRGGVYVDALDSLSASGDTGCDPSLSGCLSPVPAAAHTGSRRSPDLF